MRHKIVLGILAWFPFLGMVAMIAFPLLILWCYRFLVTVILKRLFRTDLIEPILVPDSAFGIRNQQIWDKPRSTFAFVHILEDPIHLDELQIRLRQVIHGKTLVHGQIVPNYERLTSLCPTTWLGYSFWTKVTSTFDIMNHIKHVTRSTTDIDEVVANWLTSPFEPNRPLWDVILISEFTDENGERRFLFGIRIHHMIGDGYSMIRFLQKVFDQNHTSHTQSPPKHQAVALAAILKMWFWMPLTWWADVGDNLFHSDYFSTQKFDQEICWTKVSIDLSELKLIQKKLSGAVGAPVSMVTVILFLFGAALRSTLLSDNVGASQQNLSEILKNLKVVVSMPRSSPHPEGKFSNHWGRGMFEIPLRKESPLLRLKHMVSNASWMMTSGAFEMNASFHKINSNIPQFGLDWFAENACASTVLAGNLPGPPNSVNICGSRVLDQFILNGLQLKHTSFTLVGYSYNHKMTISMVANQNVFDKVMAEEILKKVKDESNNLLSDDILMLD